MKPEPIIALDTSDPAAALDLARRLRDLIRLFKVGSELFVAGGPGVVRALREEGAEVFLDLKFHDIPHTVARACTEAARLGVHLLNVHASGGSEMMRAAVAAVQRAAPSAPRRPRLLAVTVLTSLDDAAMREIGVDHTAAGQVLHLARLAKNSGLDGVVASVREAAMIRRELGEEFLIVTPGVRPAWASADDQKRTATPRQAAEAGATHIVVGRPVTAAPDPRQAAVRLLDELKSGV